MGVGAYSPFLSRGYMKAIQDLDLHSDDFEIANGKVRTIMGRNAYNIRLHSNVVTWDNLDNPEPHVATIMNNGFDIIHLDFKVTSGSTGSRVIGFLPANCPTPTKLIEAQLWDGRSVWIDAGSREVTISSSVLNTRYIIDLVGFFNVTR